MSLIEELKRRNVFRVGVAYVIIAWLLLQVSDTLVPALHLPAWFQSGVALLLILGFPLALFFAWAFEMTPDGVKKEKDVDRAVSITQHTGRKLDFIIIGVLTVAVAMFAMDKFVWTDNAQRTIAVMPFVNMSDDSEQEYFSDGLSEELLNLLAQIPELRVTSRTSSFSFKGKDITVPEVGRALDVDHVLEGSVRRSGGTIRITAQLIETSSDTHIWSDTWDRNFEDVFVIQDEIAKFVVEALRIQLLGELPHVFETTEQAYELYLQAKYLLEHPSTANMQQAEAISQRILDIDPDYVPAWIQRANIFNIGVGWGAWESDEAAVYAREAALKSVELYEQNAEAHATLARLAMEIDFDYALAARELAAALESGNDNAFIFKTAAEFEQRQGNLDEAIEYLDKAYEIDPVAGRGLTGALAYFYAGRHEEGIDIWRDAIRESPQSGFIHKSLALSLLETGDIDGALDAIQNEPTDGHRQQGLALIYETMGNRERSTEELEKLLADSRRWTFEIAEVHSFRSELDEAFAWMDRAIARKDRGLRHVMYSPYLDNMRNDPRFEDVLRRVGLAPES